MTQKVGTLEGLVFGFIGDFSAWNLVPYVIEDKIGGSRQVYGWDSENSCFYASFSSELAISSHIIRQYRDLRRLSIVLYAPLSLIVSRSAQQMAREELHGDCEPEGEASPSLANLYQRVDGCDKTIRADEVALAVGGAFCRKIREEAERLGSSDSERDCYKEQSGFHEFLTMLFREFTRRELNRESNPTRVYECKEISLSVVPVPLALTTQIQLDKEKKIVTFRLADAADTLASILWVDMVARILEALDKGQSVVAAVDLTHGVNYASASLLRTGLSVAEALSALIQVLGSGRVSFKFYNSDPVMKPVIEIGSREAYKIHLVATLDVDPTSIPEGFVEGFLFRTLSQLGSLDRAKDAWRGYATLAGVDFEEDEFDAFVLSVLSASSGLPLWAAYFSSKLLVKHFGEDGPASDSGSLRLLAETMFRVRRKLVDFELSSSRCDNIISYNVKTSVNSNIRSLPLLFSALMPVTALREQVRLWRDCIKLEWSRELDLDVDSPVGIFNILAMRVKDRSCFDNIIRNKLKWVSLQSKTIIRNEVVPDEKIDSDKVYGYTPGGVDLRNLLAHAGFSRGAAILLQYGKSEDGKKTLKYALLADTESLRNALRSLWPRPS